MRRLATDSMINEAAVHALRKVRRERGALAAPAGAAAPDLACAARTAETIMADGFIPPEDQSDEFTRGWQAACREYASSAARTMLQTAIANLDRNAEYKIIDIRMTWRGEQDRKTGSQELAEKLTAAARDGWRLERLQFHNLPQGEGYNDLVTAYAVMVCGAGRQELWSAAFLSALAGICASQAFTNGEWTAENVIDEARRVADAAATRA